MLLILSCNNGSSSWRNPDSVLQISRIHTRLHHQLDGPVCAGDAFPHSGGTSMPRHIQRLDDLNPVVDSNVIIFQEKLESFCFLIFLVFCLICGLYVAFNVPETKNQTVLEIAAEFERMHCKDDKSQRKKHSEQDPSGIKSCSTKF